MSRFETKDYYFTQAKKLGFKARSVFKLEEIDRKYNIIKPSYKILDLGCAPGSWLQYVAKKLNSQGACLGVDISEISQINCPRIKVIKADCFELNLEIINKNMSELVNNFSGFDLILSDMAPKTSGIKHVDQIRSVELVKQVISLSEKLLNSQGNLVVKIFAGGETPELMTKIKSLFKTVRHVRPQSVRAPSKEFYAVALGKRALMSYTGS